MAHTCCMTVVKLTFALDPSFPSRYCVDGTIGHKLRPGKTTQIDLDKDTKIDVRCQVWISSILFSFSFVQKKSVLSL